MCRQVTCRSCGKATWAGCGNHVEQALAGVPKANRCSCATSSSSSARSSSSGSSSSGSSPAPASEGSGSWLTRLLRR